MNIYQYGDTVRFECVFYNFEGEKIDPQLIKVIIYDQKYKELKSEVLTSANKKDIGEYFYDYTTPKKEQKLYYEWYGEIDGTPSLRRGSFMTKFI
ncbi:hypothetical protein NXG04_07175 [Klebsiella pneumoniae]|nr:hypothetical protein [Klebsiella pneumoniae]MDS7714333.1 hypothetical protein [Klebsiella pneumoniae]